LLSHIYFILNQYPEYMPIILWLLGVPISIIILLYLFGVIGG